MIHVEIAKKFYFCLNTNFSDMKYISYQPVAIIKVLIKQPCYPFYMATMELINLVTPNYYCHTKEDARIMGTLNYIDAFPNILQSFCCCTK